MQSTASSSSHRRADLLLRLFPKGIPALWCPPLTHYDSQGAIDPVRMEAHWRFLAPFVKGMLVPGSTGDGWELTADESRALVQLALGLAAKLDVRLLIGALRPLAADARTTITATIQSLDPKAPDPTALSKILAQKNVCGFAVCPPRGADLSQDFLQKALSDLLEVGAPLALYQLPQVTLNEMAPDQVAALAAEYPNFVLFKDTSGQDRVVQSGLDLGGVFTVRGMEGQYHKWLKPAGGPYDGFLLSAANGFAPQLHAMIQHLEGSRFAEADALSQRISHAVEKVFGLLKSFPDGNVFANSGKAVDHFMAFGPLAEEVRPPRLHTGRTLPSEIIKATGVVLRESELMPKQGYLD